MTDKPGRTPSVINLCRYRASTGNSQSAGNTELVVDLSLPRDQSGLDPIRCCLQSDSGLF